MSPWISILHDALRIMAPLLLAATGGLFTEVAGILNISLEGLMVAAAFASVWIAGSTGSLLAGVVAGVFASLLLSSLFALTTLKLKGNIFIVGIATNLFATGLVTVLAAKIFGHRGVHRFDTFPAFISQTQPGANNIIGGILGGHTPFVYISWGLLILSAWFIRQTSFGLRLRGVGQESRTMRTLGVEPSAYRAAAIFISGFMCGLAGCVLSLPLGAFVPGVTAGRGWIALVIIYLGQKRPIGIFFAAMVFGLAESLSNYSQGIFQLPANLILSFPYFVSLGALVVYSIWTHYHTTLKYDGFRGKVSLFRRHRRM